MKTCLNVSYLLANILIYVCNKQNFEMYLLIGERFRVKQPMARLYKQEVEAQFWRETF